MACSLQNILGLRHRLLLKHLLGQGLDLLRGLVLYPVHDLHQTAIHFQNRISLRLVVLEIFQRHPPVPAQGLVCLAAVGNLQVGEKHPLLFFVIQIDVRLAHAAPSFPD